MDSHEDVPRGNPFNHQSAVQDREKFVGRESELSSIEYSLNQSVSDNPQYINIGITGKEGSGKTSLTYMVEEIAENLGISTVRIQLDEGQTSDEIGFFQQLYEEITLTIGGDPESSYIDAVAGRLNEVEFDLKFFVLI